MEIIAGIVLGFLAWFIVRYLIAGLYTIDQNERAVITSFGRAQRLGNATTLDDPISETLVKDEKGRYAYPQVRVVQPGFYWKWPWQRVHKVSIATSTTNMAFDPDEPRANQGGTILDAVTKDQLNIGLDGQIRYRVAESNLYAYLFGVKNPIAHVMGYFVSVLRERIANFESPPVEIARHAGRGVRRECDLVRRLDQRSAQESARPERAYGHGVQLIGGPVWHGAGCVPDHRDRSAAGGRVGPGRHQYGPQPGVFGHQPGASVGRSEDRPVATGGGD